MKKLNNRKCNWVLAGLLFTLILSCKKEELRNNLVDEVAVSLSAYTIMPYSEAAVILYNKVNIFEKAQNKGIPAVLMASEGSNVEVLANIDYNPRLIQIYDSLFHTKSPLLTAGTFAVLGSGKVTVNAGALQSADSIKVQAADLSKFAAGTYNFVVPVRMTSSSTSLKSKVMYIKYKITVANLSFPGMGVANTGGVKLYNMFLPSGYTIPLGPYIQVLLDKATPYASTFSVETISTPELAAAYSASSGLSHLPFPAGSFALSPEVAEIGVNATLPTTAKSIRLLCYGTYFKPGRYLLAARLKTPNLAVLPVAELINSPDVVLISLFVF